jgi:phenylpropionate dioxygenase-like ring-hydroxylating dioxygenase large terminal subunit
VPSIASLTTLVEPHRVHRALYVDPAIFELELERIFGRAWIYAGHESQLPNPGDYVTALVGRQPIVVIRQPDRSLRALYNRCGHRGARVVADGAGSVRFFRCCYHGWTFRTDGTVLSVPLRRGYDGTSFDESDAGFAMRRVAGIDSYRGFIFVRLAAGGPSLGDFLGGIASSLDDMVDRAPGGRIAVTGRPFRVLQRSNWKLFFENMNDAMHALSTHESSVFAARRALETIADRESGRTTYAAGGLAAIEKNGIPYATWDRTGTTVFPRGHSFMGGFSNPASYESGYVAALAAAVGSERMRAILSVNRHNSIIFPSCALRAAYQQLRVIRPLAPDRTLIEVQHFALDGAGADSGRSGLSFSNLVNSPSSIVMADDVEAFNRVQDGLASAGSDWVSLDRNFGRDQQAPDSLSAPATSELPMRNQLRAWLEYMTADG